MPLGVITLVWLLGTLPQMPNRARSGLAAPFTVLRQPSVPFGMVAVTLFFMGQFTLFTYLRPFLETGDRRQRLGTFTDPAGDGSIWLLGTSLIGKVLTNRLYSVLVGIPVAMLAIASALIAFGSSPIAVTALLALWGLLGTAAPVGWWTWLSKALPEDAEAGGGLMVAVIQLAITAGAAGGGLLFDGSGYQATFTVSALLLGASAAFAVLGARTAGRRAALDWLAREDGSGAAGNSAEQIAGPEVDRLAA